jgi:hypothetical protein
MREEQTPRLKTNPSICWTWSSFETHPEEKHWHRRDDYNFLP